MGATVQDRRLLLLERVGVALLLVAALVPRMGDYKGAWDRELEGFQGSFFTLCALNYERLGVGYLGGYPLLNVDLPPDPKEASYKYPNHPPAVPLLTWASLKVFGPPGWNTAWEEGKPPPPGTEPAARFPFLALHVLGLLALWWAVRQAGGAQIALLTLAVASAIPISVLYSTLVNYENPCLPFVLFAYGFHARYLKHGRPRDLLWCGVAFFAGACVTFTPAIFVPPIVLQLWYHRGWRRALSLGAVASAAVLTPAILHGIWVRAAMPGEATQNVYARVSAMLRPLLSGEAPLAEWAHRQWLRMDYFFSTPILLAACLGLAVALWTVWSKRASRKEDPTTRRITLGLPLLGGGALVFLLFYHHTWDGDRADNGQTIFLMNLVPACAVLAATCIDALTRPLGRLRAGFAPLVLVVGLLVMPGLARTHTLRVRWRAPGPQDDPALTAGPAAPLPHTAGREIAEVLPPGAIGFYPRAMGLTPITTGYYAWRSVFAVADEESYSREAVKATSACGLVGNPQYLLIPLAPPDHAVREVEAIRAIIAEKKLVREAATDRWELWRIQ